MPYTVYVKRRIIDYIRMGKSYGDIVRELAGEGHKVSKEGIHYFLAKYEQTGLVEGNQGQGVF